MNSKKEHLQSIRGVASFIVVITHYLGAFYPFALFGNDGLYQQRSSWEIFFSLPPLSLISSGNFAVCMFFVLSGYVLSYKYLGENDNEISIIGDIIKRPFRLGGIVLFSTIFSSILWENNLFFNTEASQITSSIPWFYKYWNSSITLNAITRDMTTSFFLSANKYNPPLWTIRVELIGSIFVYAFLFFFATNKYRALATAFCIYYFKGNLIQGFFFGIALADIKKHYSNNFEVLTKKYLLVSFLLLGLLFSSYPAHTSSDIVRLTFYGKLPKLTYIGGGYSMLGAIFLFFSIDHIKAIQTLLSHKYLVFLGRISYAMYAVHYIILGSFSSWLFIKLLHYYKYGNAFLLVFLISLIIILIISYVETVFVDEQAIRLSRNIKTSSTLLLQKLINKFC